MATSLASATIEWGGTSTDIVVPAGTTVATVLTMMQVDIAGGDVAVTTTDGFGADPGAMIGYDIPAGAVLSITAARQPSRIHHDRSSSRQSSYRYHVVLLAVACVFVWIVGALVTWLAAHPVTHGSVTNHAGVRDALAVACAIFLGAVVIRQARSVCTPIGMVMWTAATAALPVIFLDTSDPLMATILPVVSAWVACGAAFATWIFVRGSVPATVAAVWAAVALVVSAIVVWDLPAGRVAPLVLALSVLLCTIVPDASMRVPDSQLLDLPVVTTSAPAVRTFGVAAMKRVSDRRVLRVLARAEGTSESLVIACSMLAVASGIAVSRMVVLDEWHGRAALLLMMAVALGFALLPRTSQSKVPRVYPRIAALVVGILGATSPAVTAFLGTTGVTALLMGAALFFVFGTVAINRGPAPVLLARMGEIVQGISLVAVLPVSIVAAGIFEFVRQVAS